VADVFGIEIATPERLLAREKAIRAQIPAKEGYIGVLPDHATLLSELGIGAYGFGFTSDGKFLVMDLSGKEILSVPSAKDDKLVRPRPLMMKKSADGVQLLSGRNYINITAK